MLPFPAFDRSFKRKGGLAVWQDHEAVGKVLVNVPANESVHSMAALATVCAAVLGSDIGPCEGAA
jgi:hypothetical protein